VGFVNRLVTTDSHCTFTFVYLICQLREFIYMVLLLILFISEVFVKVSHNFSMWAIKHRMQAVFFMIHAHHSRTL
jgi:hypothetical protein